MMPITYLEWKKRRKEIAEDSKAICDHCDGDGEAECDMGHMHECEECEGLGTVSAITGTSDTRAAYFKEVIHEIRRACVFTRRDFLAEVGPFVRAFRNGDLV